MFETRHVFINKFKVPWSENVVQFLTPLYPYFTLIVVSNVPWQNMSNFLNVVLDKFPVDVLQYLLVYEFNDKWVRL